MDLVITYDMVKGLLVNCALRNHFSRALRRIPGPQSTVNGWSGAVLLPKMYTLVDGKPFKQEMTLQLLVPNFPPIYNRDGTAVIPYTQEQTLKITSGFAREKNYYDTASNIYPMLLRRP